VIAPWLGWFIWGCEWLAFGLVVWLLSQHVGSYDW